MGTTTALDFDLSQFPLGDGDSMPEIDSHYIQMHDLRFSLDLFLSTLPRVHLGGNHFVYYNHLNHRDNVAPDVYVAFDIERKQREAYFAFVEGKFPDIVFEIVSPTNTRRELREKHALYERQGVQEYYLCDPLWTARSLLRTPVEGYIRSGNQLVAASVLPGGGYRSALLGAELRMQGPWLRLVDPTNEQFVPVPKEQTAARLDAEARVEEEIEARLTAEAHAAREAARRLAAEAHAARELVAREAAQTQAARETAARQIAESEAAAEAVARQAAESHAAAEAVARQAAEARAVTEGAARQIAETQAATEAAAREAAESHAATEAAAREAAESHAATTEAKLEAALAELERLRQK